MQCKKLNRIIWYCQYYYL